MPVFDLECKCGVEEDVYISRTSQIDPPCPRCGCVRKRLVGMFSTPLMGSVRKYNDLKREGSEQEGFWAYRKVSSISGQPEPVWLSTMQEVRAFNRAEGLADPMEVPTNCTITADGKRIVSSGMPGQWTNVCDPKLTVPSRVWEMDTKLTSLDGKTPEPVASGPPCTIERVDASMMDKLAAQMGG